jgi:cell division protein FtsW
MLFAGNARFLHLGATVVVAISSLAAYAVTAEYRLKRILSYLGQDTGNHQNGTDPYYQVHQAIIGLGNGGIWGVGMGQSKQRDLFLPESYGDFIYAVIGEEYGFIGATAILAVFCLIMIRGMKIAKHAPDNLGKFLAVGITCSLCLYALVNAGVSCGLFPTTGLPMPLVSYGGTSIIFTSFAFGVLLNVSTYLRQRSNLSPMIVREDQAGRVY